MNSGIITFSFDDARLDSVRAIKIAHQYGIRSTLNVTTAYVDGTRKDLREPSYLPAMSIDDVHCLENIGTEIACHGDEHNNNIGNIIKGKRKLEEWFPEKKEFGFASPHSEIDLSAKSLSLLKESGIKYVRIGPFGGTAPIIVRMKRKIAEKFNSPWLLYSAYKDTLENPIQNSYLIRSVSVMRHYTVDQLIYMAEKAAKEKLWCVFMFHSILDENESGFSENFSWPLKSYRDFCEKIGKMNDRIKFLTTIDALKLINGIKK